MENRNPHIELPNAQLIRQNQRPPVPYNELPQDDEDHHDHQELQALQQNPPQGPQNPTPKVGFKAWLTVLFGRDLDKAMIRAVRLMLLCYVLDLILIYPIINDYYYAKIISKTEILGALEFMSANLKADPIVDLQIISKKSACPAGFEPLEGIWCGRRAVLGTDYLKKAECPNGFQECYNGGCFKGECPITKIEMNSKEGLVIAKTKGGLPLINIQTSSYDIPCFNRDFSAKFNSSYKLLDGEGLTNKGCDKYGLDYKYSTRLNAKLMVDSDKDSTMNLPSFEKYLKETTSVLSWRVRMKTAKNDYCLDLDQNLAKISTTAFRKAFLSDIHIHIALIVISHFLILILLSFGIYRCCLGKEQFRESFESITDIASFICLTLTLCLWPVWVFDSPRYYPELRMAKNYFVEYDLLGCFGGSQGGEVIQDLLWMLGKGETSYYIHFGLFLSNVLASLTCFWHLWMKLRIAASMRAYILNHPRN